MSGVNKVIVVGRLGNDPEIRYTPGGQPVGKLSVATSENWTDKQGQKQERTEWHRIVVWGKLAEICGQHLAKGRQVYVEGRLQTRSWDDKASGQKKYATEIVATTVQFLGTGTGTSANSGANAGAGAGAGGSGGSSAYSGSSRDMDQSGPGAGAGGSHDSGADFSPEPPFDSDSEIPF